jgi:O-antigen/teichoic acid export membrane protein
MLDLGYAASLVKFVTQYRARRDSRALNELASTMFMVFALIGIVAYGVAMVIAFNLTRVFDIGPTPATTGRQILLIVGVYIALGFPCSVYGGIVNGFQRRYLNGAVAILTSIIVAAVNIVLLLRGHGLVAVVAGTTLVRCLSYVGYRMTAHRVFPALRISPRFFRLERLREITRFSAYMFVIDLANKLNYASDTIVIGAVLNTTAVAVWTVAQRMSDIIQRLTDQLNSVLFPVIVDSATHGNEDRLRRVLLQGTRLSLAMVLPLAIGLALLAQPLVLLWVGPTFLSSVIVVQILAVAVMFRVGSSPARGLLLGAGDHALVARVNVATGVVNVVLSVMLAGTFGLAGVAVGTVVPVSFAAVAVLFPMACRRVRVPVAHALLTAVWPPFWPAMCMAGVLGLSRPVLGDGAAALVFQTVVGGIVFTSLFLGFAISGLEREWYLSTLRRVFAGSRLHLPARSS